MTGKGDRCIKIRVNAVKVETGDRRTRNGCWTVSGCGRSNRMLEVTATMSEQDKSESRV
jgi:hypothetical protein